MTLPKSAFLYIPVLTLTSMGWGSSWGTYVCQSYLKGLDSSDIKMNYVELDYGDKIRARLAWLEIDKPRNPCSSHSLERDRETERGRGGGGEKWGKESRERGGQFSDLVWHGKLSLTHTELLQGHTDMSIQQKWNTKCWCRVISLMETSISYHGLSHWKAF